MLVIVSYVTRYEKTDHLDKLAKIAFLAPLNVKFNDNHYGVRTNP